MGVSLKSSFVAGLLIILVAFFVITSLQGDAAMTSCQINHSFDVCAKSLY